jgi:hypothetical protein
MKVLGIVSLFSMKIVPAILYGDTFVSDLCTSIVTFKIGPDESRVKLIQSVTKKCSTLSKNIGWHFSKYCFENFRWDNLCRYSNAFHEFQRIEPESKFGLMLSMTCITSFYASTL